MTDPQLASFIDETIWYLNDLEKFWIWLIIGIGFAILFLLEKRRNALEIRGRALKARAYLRARARAHPPYPPSNLDKDF